MADRDIIIEPAGNVPVTDRGILTDTHFEYLRANGELTNGALQVRTGTGNPNGIVDADASVRPIAYIDLSAVVAPILWIKPSGVGNTGWVAV